MKPRDMNWLMLLITFGIMLGALSTSSRAENERSNASGTDSQGTDSQGTDSQGTDSQGTDSQGTVEESYTPKTAVELRKKLSVLQYNVTQKEATERPFKNLYWNHKRAGDYRCIVCDLPLFSSETKYESGTGWPSFYAPLSTDNLGTRTDWRLIYSRTEVHCRRCNAHLGHVFDDGPKPTGKRYCMNSASLRFVEKKDNPASSDSEEANDVKPAKWR